MRKLLLRSTMLSLCVYAGVAVFACSNASSIVAGGATPPQNKQPPTVVTRSHMEVVAGDTSTVVKEVNQECQANEQVVGGGYRFEEAEVDLTQTTPHGPPFLTESRPGGNGWTVGFFARGAFTATVYAQCLIGGAGTVFQQSKSIDVPLSPPTQLWSVAGTCPSGSSPVGGGFSTHDLDVVDLFPTGGGYFVNLSGHDEINGATAIALCYSRAAAVSVVRDHRVQLSGELGSINTATFSPTCPIGAGMTTGGYEGEPNDIAAPFINGPNMSGAGWQVQLLSISSLVNINGVTGDVACVTFPS